MNAYVALGSNLGDRENNICSALRLLGGSAGVIIVRSAGIIETVPVGSVEQPDFLNTVCEVSTDLSPLELLKLCQSIEKELGRERTEESVRWGPRVIDLDIILYGDMELDEPGLVVPHPQMHLRKFVLEPLAQIAPGLIVPGMGTTVGGLLEALGC